MARLRVKDLEINRRIHLLLPSYDHFLRPFDFFRDIKLSLEQHEYYIHQF
jgi:hypothetical protein